MPHLGVKTPKSFNDLSPLLPHFNPKVIFPYYKFTSICKGFGSVNCLCLAINWYCEEKMRSSLGSMADWAQPPYPPKSPQGQKSPIYRIYSEAAAFMKYSLATFIDLLD